MPRCKFCETELVPGDVCIQDEDQDVHYCDEECMMNDLGYGRYTVKEDE